MKKMLPAIGHALLILLLCPSVSAQSWSVVGNPGLCDGYVKGWTHNYYDYLDPVTSQPDYKLLFSLKINGNNIGTIAGGTVNGRAIYNDHIQTLRFIKQ